MYPVNGRRLTEDWPDRVDAFTTLVHNERQPRSETAVQPNAYGKAMLTRRGLPNAKGKVEFPMSPIIASVMGGVNPSYLKNTAQSRLEQPETSPEARLPVSAGCAAAPRFIQLHPRLLKLHPLDLATYVLLCERTITGLYPAGVPLSGADLARFFEADESVAAGTRYNRALKRLVQAELVVREPRPGRKACYQPQWPGTQRREPTPLSAPYPHRLFVPIYLRLFEQFIGTFHPTASGPAEIERFVETPSLDPLALHAWASARWAAWRNEPVPEIEPAVVERLRTIGLWDDTGVFDPEQPQTPAARNVAASTPVVSAPVDVARTGDASSARAAAWTMLDLMAQQMKLMQEQIAAMQQILLGDSSTPIIAAGTDQVAVSASESLKSADTKSFDSTNTDSNNNTEITNTDQTLEYLHPQTPSRRRRSGGGGDQKQMSMTTEAEQLLREAGVIASNARRFAERRPEQVQAAINFAQKSQRRFEDPAGMIVWLLDKNEFADAHEQPGLPATNDEALNRCWYCGKSGCTTCKIEHEQRLMSRWGGAEFDGGPLWKDLQAVAREELPGLPVDAAEAQVVRRERLILVADEEPAMALRAVRGRLIELAARRLGVKVDIVITRRPQQMSPLPLPVPVARVTPLDAPQTPYLAPASRKELEAPLDAGSVVSDADDALKAAAAGLPELVRALFRGAHVEPDPAAAVDAETFYLHAGSPMAAERLRKQPALAERIVGAAVGRPVRVTIRDPDRPRLAARRSVWR